MANKSFDFAIRIVNLYKYLTDVKKEYVFQNNCCEVVQQLVHYRVKEVLLKVNRILFISMILHKKNVTKLYIGLN